MTLMRMLMSCRLFSIYPLFPGSADEDSGVGGSPGSRPSMTHSCHMCNKKFSRADILKKHIKTTHTNTSCTVCGQLFNDKAALAKHQVEVGNHEMVGDINAVYILLG